ncbi:hypothetical protein ACQKMD_20610 [Viridibacillus sp. NPDC096237]|uniref:hypothetical protein n=1 Tax=Viridibacillus sp. NPDC096237 TaxID=3390721 RepID=UPI003D0384A0
MKKLLLTVASILLLATTGNVASASELKSGNEQKLNYKNWVDEQIDSATGDEKTELLNSYKQYKEISNEDQEKFVEYIYNPQEQEQALRAFATVPENSSRSLQNGDIEVTSTFIEEELPGKAKGTAVPVKKTYKRALSIKGIKILESTIWVQHMQKDGEITGTPIADAFTSVNLYPTLSDTYSSPAISNTKLVVVASSVVTFTTKIDNIKYAQTGTIAIYSDVNGYSDGTYTTE